MAKKKVTAKSEKVAMKQEELSSDHAKEMERIEKEEQKEIEAIQKRINSFVKSIEKLAVKHDIKVLLQAYDNKSHQAFCSGHNMETQFEQKAMLQYFKESFRV